MSRFRKAVLLTPLLVATSIVPLAAQNHHNNDSAYYNGMRNGTRGGNYYNDRDPRYNNNYHPDYHNDHRQGGIGPGKGALIGGAGVLLVSGIAFNVTRTVSVIWVNRRTTSDVRTTMHSFLSQAESAGEIVGGFALAALAQAGGVSVTLLTSAALIAATGVVVARSRYGAPSA